MENVHTFLLVMGGIFIAIMFLSLIFSSDPSDQYTPEEELRRLGQETRTKISAVCDQHTQEVQERLEAYHRQKR